MRVDLHIHTHHSDGSLTPAEVVAHARRLGLKHIAITDHDTTAGIDEAREASGGDPEIIPAIEINTVWPDAAGDEDVHVLGYFIDKDCPALVDIIARQKAARLKLVDDTIAVLAAAGIEMTREHVQQFAGVGSIGRPHISRAIVRAGGAADVFQAYEKFMTRSSAHFIPRQSVTPQEAIASITASGGIASIAHPGASRKIEQIILHLKDCGLQAVEAYHRRHSLPLVRHYIRFANRHGLLVTGGSDCHGPYEDCPPSMGSISVPTEVLHKLRAVRPHSF